MDAFAAENGKTPRQVKEAFSFLACKRIWDYVDDGAGNEGKNGGGRGGKMKVARRLEREMRADRYVLVFFGGGGFFFVCVVMRSIPSPPVPPLFWSFFLFFFNRGGWV